MKRDKKKVIREFENWCEAMADECPVICHHVLDLLNEQEEYRYEYEKGFNDAMQGKRELMYEGIDGKWYKKDW